MPIPEKSGPVLAFYPAGEQEHLKMADDTKAELKKAIKPSEINIQVAKFRKIGNTGVVVQTTSQEYAQKLRPAAPPTLRVTEPRQHMPLVAIRGFEDDLNNEGASACSPRPKLWRGRGVDP
ncbi:unnamed protein product [Parnassius apollo]|uniref:(apollo) hypothetical protein n=1 Tax=Parnassius apollo TaxID=110799 RepID=A0A8S3WUD0_PARAO|nr:unnamed protein product [Parnassius apollo]